MNTSKVYEPQEHVVWLLKRLFHHAHRMVDEAVRGYGITAAQVGVLNRLYGEPGLSGADLARRLLITPQGAQLALAALERQGLVERTPDPNHGRIVRTSLTKEGRRVVEVSMADRLAAEERLLASLSPEEQKTLITLLQRLISELPEDPSSAGEPDGHP